MTALACEKIEIGSSKTAFTLVETIVSSLIVGTMLVAALSTVGASRLSQYKTSQTTRGQLLAESLMYEILRQHYQEPTDPVQFGRESGEGTDQRTAWDDVDDYDGWSKSPPEYKDGSTFANCDGWRRTVTVAWVNPLDPTQVQVSESNAKRITVQVSYEDVPVASLVGIKTASGS